MTHVLIVHEVADYTAWKSAFDGAADIRRAAGERTYQVMRDGGNVVVHLSTWTSHAAAHEFFESDELVRIRADAGVSAPAFHYLDELESGSLEPSA